MSEITTHTVYVRMKKKVKVARQAKVFVKDIADLSTSEQEMQHLDNVQLYQLSKKDKQYVVIDSLTVINQLQKSFPHLEFQLVGFTETIVQVLENKQKSSMFFISFVWIVLFIGTAMTIMNFHYDVSMLEVQQKLHYIFTGEHKSHPLWIQIPYSFGLGVGMILFLNHWFNKRFNEEPSPLEIEMFKYQKSLDDYITYYENELNNAKNNR